MDQMWKTHMNKGVPFLFIILILEQYFTGAVNFTCDIFTIGDMWYFQPIVV